MRTGRVLGIFAATATVALTGCSSATGPDAAPAQTSQSPAPMATPLIGSVLADPVPVPATDGRTHLAYELMLTNVLGGNVTLTSLMLSADHRELLTLAGPNLTYWTRVLGNPGTPATVIGPGQSALIWLDVTVDNGQVPADITHSVTASVAKPIPGLVPAEVSFDIAPVHIGDRKAVTVAPPLDGPNWVDANGCCDTTPHRLAANPINGKLWVAERFAIDYVQLDDAYRLFTGDPTKVDSYRYFGAEVHAVGSGKVVSVVDDLPEQTPTKSPSGLPLDQYGGNHIVEDLGNGAYAFYAHLQPGSITVKPGDELNTGQTIAKLGNSGNTDAPHLHFHVMDGPDPLMANGLPFEITSFRLDQRIASAAALDTLFAGKPAPLQAGFAARELHDISPLNLDVMSYSVGQ